jgi:hypothetical protein
MLSSDPQGVCFGELPTWSTTDARVPLLLAPVPEIKGNNLSSGTDGSAGTIYLNIKISKACSDFGLDVEIVAGPLHIQAIGCLGKSYLTSVCHFERRLNWVEVITHRFQVCTISF